MERADTVSHPKLVHMHGPIKKQLWLGYIDLKQEEWEDDESLGIHVSNQFRTFITCR